MVANTSSKALLTRNSLWAALKWLLAIALLVAVFRSGKLSTGHIHTFLNQPQAALLALGLLAINYLLSFYRWKILLHAIRLPLTSFQALKLGMIGQFFSTVIPGTVGGDFVKAVFVARRYPSRGALAVTTIFLDRILGLFGVLILGSTAFLWGRSHMLESSHRYLSVVMGFGWFIVIVSVAVILTLGFLPVLGKKLPSQVPAGLKRLPASGLLTQFYEAALEYRQKVGVLWAALGIGMLMQIINIWAQWIIARAIFGPAPWGQVELTAFVLGTVLGGCAMSVPVAPLGLGVGQVAFSAIFVALGAPNEAFGAAVVTGSQIISLALNLFGVFFFVTYKNEVQQNLSQASSLAAETVDFHQI